MVGVFYEQGNGWSRSQKLKDPASKVQDTCHFKWDDE